MGFQTSLPWTKSCVLDKTSLKIGGLTSNVTGRHLNTKLPEDILYIVLQKSMLFWIYLNTMVWVINKNTTKANDGKKWTSTFKILVKSYLKSFGR